MSATYPFVLSAEHGGDLAPPRRRQHPGQPPSLLTTSLTNAQNLGMGYGAQLPLANNALSSPFSHLSPSPYSASPGGSLVGSPMVSRSAAVFSGQYNPQQWGPISSVDNSPAIGAESTFVALHTRQTSTRTTTFAARPVGPDEPIGSPPPPYSPSRPEETQRDGLISPADTLSPNTDSSFGNTPISAATTVSPGLVLPKYDRRSSGGYHTHSPSLGQPSTFPPPPPPPSSGGRVRSATNILAAMSLRNRNTNVPPPVAAIDTLTHNTVQALAGRREEPRIDPSLQPPSARRAASTGAIGLARGPSPSESSNPTRWTNGRQLPPPPPGPPPSTGSRSQSHSRPMGSSLSIRDPGSEQRGRHAPPGRGTNLETVPPTPADWREDSTSSTSQSNWPRTLHIDTDNISRESVTQGSVLSSAADSSSLSHTRSPSSNGMLLRSPAVRNRSAKGIRERRSESRTGTGKGRELQESLFISSPVDGTPEIRPFDLVASSPSSGGISRRRTSTRLTPRSANKNFPGLDETLANGGMPSGGMASAGMASAGMASSARSSHFESSNNTPRLERPQSSKQQLIPASPFSPSFDSSVKESTNPRPLSRALRSPPSQQLQQPSSAGMKPRNFGLMIKEQNNMGARPISSILHMPNPDVPIGVMPLSPDNPNSPASLISIDGPESPKEFASRAAHRYRMFAEREMACSNDSDRLHAFCEFMVAESRIRRQQYAAVFETEEIEIAELTEGMFEPVDPDSPEQKSAGFGQSALPETATPHSSGTSFSESRSRGNSTTATSEPGPMLTIDTSCATQNMNRNSVRWNNDYQPCLSPIASMSAVTRDEDSRGRAPSRWWESQSGGDDDGFKVLGRSKRESRYMAVPQEARNSPAFFEHSVPSTMDDSHHSGSTNRQTMYGPDEFPPEKSGWLEPKQEQRLLPPPPPHPPTPLSAPVTPDPRKLDISRLITLPPPYPRHHPAVNNSHPELADIRTVVRSLNDLAEATTTREAYETRVAEKRARADSWCQHQRSLHNQDIQYRIEHNELSQAQFDAAEASLESAEAASKKELLQEEFDSFQSSVLSPLHTLFADRISKATTAFESLITRLSTDAQSHSPNLPQEEGDEQPELLEKLTQLKWLFEARESLHRETYNLLSDRNDKYKAIVLHPYLQSQNHEKKADAEAFFQKDALARRAAFEKAALARAEHFLGVIESHVTRGVEVLISAFWDIAPGILSLLQQIPQPPSLRIFDILIPRAEMTENPAYYAHPLRYLYTLLTHAESSTRQFIESQVSLWCLLQEVRENVHAVRGRLEEAEANVRGGEVGWERRGEREEEGKRIVEDLKEKVREVEMQWDEALGGEMGRCVRDVRGFLEESGGWDDELVGE